MHSNYNPPTNPDEENLISQPIQQQPILTENHFFPNDFYLHASSGHGVLISACTNMQSGCHDFARSLKDEFDEALEHVKLFEDYDSYPPAIFVPSLAKSNYRYVFLTGCLLHNSKEIVSNYLRHRYRIAMERVYIVIPPHHQALIDSNYILTKCQFKAVGSPYKVQIFNTGIDSSIPANLGNPSSIPVLEPSKYKIPEKCYGLIYINGCDLANNPGQQYLNAYFSQVAKAARLNDILSCSVFLIGMDIPTKDYIQEIATNYSITIIHSNRLKQNNFISCLEKIANKNGVIATDGVQTLRQLLNFKCRFMVFNTKDTHHNTSYFLSLVNALSEELKDIGKVILGQCDNYSLLNENEEKIQKIFLDLHLLEVKSVEKFRMGIQEANEIKKTAELEQANLMKLMGLYSDRNQQRTTINSTHGENTQSENLITPETPMSRNKVSCCTIS